MSFKIIIEDRAASEIQEANNWYFQKSALAASNFKNEITQTLNSLKTGIIEYREAIPGVNLFQLKIFPYNIYYRKLNEINAIQIIALLHNKREPDFIIRRLHNNE